MDRKSVQIEITYAEIIGRIERLLRVASASVEIVIYA